MKFLVVVVGFNYFLWGSHATKALRVTLESLNITYINSNFGEAFVQLVPVSKFTNKIRARIRFYFEPTDKLMISITMYKVGKNDKAYKFSHLSRPLKTLMILAQEGFLVEEWRPHITPYLYWPPQANVTYILQDYWLPKSKVPVVELPYITGRFKAIGDAKYGNNGTLIGKGESVAKFFYSDEDID